MPSERRIATASALQAEGLLIVQDGNHGESRPRRDEFVDEGVAFIRAADLAGGRVLFERVSRINAVAMARITKGIGAPQDTVISHKGTVGRVAMAPDFCEPYVCSPQTTFWRSTDTTRLDPRYLFAYLRSPEFQRQLDAYKGESDMAPYVSLTIQRTLKISLPSIDEQRRIAGVVTALDTKIDHNARLVRHLLESAATAMAIEANGHGTTSIYEIASVTYGQPYSAALFGSEGVPVLRIRDLESGTPGMRTTEKHPRGRLVRAGDIVVGMDGEFRAHLWRGEDVWLNQRVCAFDPKPGISRAFVLEAIKKPLAHFETTKTGGTVIHLGKADIDTFQVPQIGDDAMRKLVSTVDPLVDLAIALHRESRNLRSTRDLLLPKLISGQVRVLESYDPDDVLGAVAPRTDDGDVLGESTVVATAGH